MISKLLSILLIFGILVCCAPVKEKVTDFDLQRALTAFSRKRVALQWNQSSENGQSDYDVFAEACSYYRLDPQLVLAKLKSENPKLYKHLSEDYEK